MASSTRHSAQHRTDSTPLGDFIFDAESVLLGLMRDTPSVRPSLAHRVVHFLLRVAPFPSRKERG